MRVTEAAMQTGFRVVRRSVQSKLHAKDRERRKYAVHSNIEQLDD